MNTHRERDTNKRIMHFFPFHVHSTQVSLCSQKQCCCVSFDTHIHTSSQSDSLMLPLSFLRASLPFYSPFFFFLPQMYEICPFFFLCVCALLLFFFFF